VFVAEANENSVSVLDLATSRASEKLRTAKGSQGPARRHHPTSLTLDPTGHRLYVANAGANHVAVFDRVAARTLARARVPAGGLVPHRPCACAPGHREFLVSNGKGAGSRPSSIAAPDTSAWCRYLSYSPAARGTLSLVREPD
jgi:DNA-binding beta-propeller fold protein YncE